MCKLNAHQFKVKRGTLYYGGVPLSVIILKETPCRKKSNRPQPSERRASRLKFRAHKTPDLYPKNDLFIGLIRFHRMSLQIAMIYRK